MFWELHCSVLLGINGQDHNTKAQRPHDTLIKFMNIVNIKVKAS